MTAMTDFDRLVASWLEAEGPSDVREEIVEAAIATARGTRRRSALATAVAGPRPWPATSARRVGRVPWRLAIVVGLVVVALLLAIALVGGARPIVPLGDGVLAIADDAGLTVAASDGTDPRRILSEGPAFDPRWSPDGAYVALLIGGGRLQTLVVVGSDGSIVGRSALVKEYRWLGSLLLVRRDGNGIDILKPDLIPDRDLMPIDVAAGGGPSNPLVADPLADLLAVRRDHASGAINAWGGSPQDRGTITFVTFRPGHGSGGAGLKTAGTDVREMVWSPSEDRLAFIDTTCDPTTPPAACSGVLKTIASNGTDQVTLTDSVSAAQEPVWDATGQRLLTTMLNVSVGGGPALVMVHVDRVPALVSRLTFDPTDSNPRWAPDGLHVLFLRERAIASGTTQDAWTIGTDSFESTRVASDVNGADWRPTP